MQSICLNIILTLYFHVLYLSKVSNTQNKRDNMNKLDRQQAAWKAQQAIEIAAEEARLARLETYIDVELQQINQDDHEQCAANQLEWQTIIDPDNHNLSPLERQEWIEKIAQRRRYHTGQVMREWKEIEEAFARPETYIELDQADKAFVYEMNLIEDLYMEGK